MTHEVDDGSDSTDKKAWTMHSISATLCECITLMQGLNIVAASQILNPASGDYTQRLRPEGLS